MAIVLIALLGIGTSFIYSASFVMAGEKYNDSNYFLTRQIVYLFMGAVVVLIVSKIRYQSLRGYLPLFYGFTLILNLLLYVDAFNVTVNGATRWINLFGITFQPSELAKLTLILTLGHIIDLKVRTDKINDFKKGILPILMYSGVLIGLVLFQKHLSATGILVFILVCMILLSGIHIKYILTGGGAVVLLAIIGVLMEPFRIVRMLSFLDPYADKLGAGFHVIQSWYALAGGGMFGLGLGMSREKFQWLPENHTDFILAVIGEEIGFLGVVVIFGLFIWFLFRGLMISLEAPDLFGKLIGFGIVSMFFFQIAINISVITGMFPVTGMPLPFVSYGGTSTIMMMGAVGILFNIASQKKEQNNDI